MSPNLYVLLHDLVHPHSWFKHKHQNTLAVPGQPLARTEHWRSPVPGVYRHKPGCGWFLIQLDADPSKPERPDKVIFSAALNRGVLESDYNARSKMAPLPTGATPSPSRPISPTRPRTGEGSPYSSRNNSYIESKEKLEVHFVRMDDGVTWVNDRNAMGEPTQGPWQRFCYDKATGEMRVMLKRDDPTRSTNKDTTSRPSSTRTPSSLSMTTTLGTGKTTRPSSLGSNAALQTENKRPVSLRSLQAKAAVEDIRAMAPELDQQPPTPSFLGPRSLHGSARNSKAPSRSESPRPSMDAGRRKSVMSVTVAGEKA